jgi:predicted transcriptional regulator
MSIQASPTTALQFELRHRLALTLEHTGLKPETIAAELGCSPTTIRNYLAGRTEPTRATVIAWAWKCGVSVAWLEHGEIDLDGPDSGPDLGIAPESWKGVSAGGEVVYLRVPRTA